MKFVTFLVHDSQRLGVLTPDEARVIDIPAAAAILNLQTMGTGRVPATMMELVSAGEGAVEAIRLLLDRVDRVSVATHEVSEVHILAPIPRVEKNIYCIGVNYFEHSKEFDLRTGTIPVKGTEPPPVPQAPIVFTKTANSVINPGETILLHPEVTQEVDYEAELAVVIGRRGSNIRPDEAYDYIFGYTCLNDVTARDLQRRHQQWLLGKSLDTFCPMGPALVHRSALPGPLQVNIQCYVNGELRQNSNTECLIFDIPTLISTLSAGRTLEPGDIIATGTPSGVGIGMKPPQYLKHGDVISVQIEGIGVLTNPCR